MKCYRMILVNLPFINISYIIKALKDEEIFYLVNGKLYMKILDAIADTDNEVLLLIKLSLHDL